MRLQRLIVASLLGFVARYAPPVDVVPYRNDLYSPTGTEDTR